MQYDAHEMRENKKVRDKCAKNALKREFRFLIIVVFLVTMVTTILISAMLHLRWARVNMTEEANSYSHQVSSWVLEQQSILGMFVNEVAIKPDMVRDYREVVKWLDNVSKHYPGISAAYIANPAFDEIHGHPMIMNNGWIPADDYVGEERDWYVGAINISDYSITEPYDAMTSKRSYRGVLPQDVVKNEIEKGIGTQFDPLFAKIMMEMIEEDTNYEFHES